MAVEQSETVIRMTAPSIWENWHPRPISDDCGSQTARLRVNSVSLWINPLLLFSITQFMESSMSTVRKKTLQIERAGSYRANSAGNCQSLPAATVTVCDVRLMAADKQAPPTQATHHHIGHARVRTATDVEVAAWLRQG